ncbi:unnamed protein product [Caenorhabditis auriculariae]|uniref:Hydroxylysine kinase n=1 Tax=Caenorhabditis auriculariae TaxID=2777116 RepID=A0A8S1H9N2_9PELO|nr:unnamed protein product [Caenorhabditis auriculariae]
MGLYPIDEPTQVPNISSEVVCRILNQHYGIANATLTKFSGYEDCNYRVSEITWKEDRIGPRQECLVVKITNPIEARLSSHLDVQIEFCRVLSEIGIPVPELVQTVDQQPYVYVEVAPNTTLPIRVFELLEGSHLEDFDFDKPLVKMLGELLAKIHSAADANKLSSDHVPFISPLNHVSLLKEAQLLKKNGNINDEQFKLVQESLQEAVEIIEKSKDIGVIHSDLNETNVLLRNNGKSGVEITGVLDMGDMHTAPRVFDIGATILYLILSDRKKSPWSGIIENLLHGYRSKREFKEGNYLLSAMKSRLAASLTYGLRTARLNVRGESVDYILKTQINGWTVLKELTKLDREQFK